VLHPEQEAREILCNALIGTNTAKRGLGSQIVELFSGSGIYIDEDIAEVRGHPIVSPDFE
jgi:hypothetical protein